MPCDIFISLSIIIIVGQDVIGQPLTPEEIEKVGKVVEEAVAAGALGVSTSRISVHRDRAGVLLPGSLASNDELRAVSIL